MSFVSYAQNFEDVMLRRALKHVKNGFYIDVGAWSPDLDSVTRAFYDMGWRGINIEPNPEFHGQLCTKRQRDINLKLAVSDSEAVLTMNFLSNPGLSTLDDHIAIKHVASGLVVERSEVQVTTLSALWREHVPPDQEVHFLKVDVEGAEKAVLEGNDWQQCRPWIVLVEATLPMEQTDSYAAWEPILLAAQYNFAYADGLNRYYVASDRAGLMDSFRHPPNVFDDFVLSAQREAEVQLAQAQAQARGREADAQAALAQARAKEAEARAAVAQALAKEADVQVARAQAGANETEAHVARAQAVQAKARAKEAEAQAAQAQARVNEAEIQAAQAQALAKEDGTQAAQALARAKEADAQAQQATARAYAAEAALVHTTAQLQAIHASFSWRITAPLRFVAGLVLHPGVTIRSSLNHMVHRGIEVAQRLLARSMSFVLRRPHISQQIRRLLVRYPTLYQQLLGVAHRQGVVPSAARCLPPATAASQAFFDEALDHLSPRARHVYADLNAAIEKQKSVH